MQATNDTQVQSSNTVGHDNQTACDSFSWKDLPPAFLCHILSVIPYKRADVKAVCSSWRQAINSSLNDVKIPAADLPLLRQLPNITHLSVNGTASGTTTQQQAGPGVASVGDAPAGQQPCGTWPPSAAAKSTKAAATGVAAVPECAAAAPAGPLQAATASGSSSISSSGAGDVSSSNPWSHVEPRMLNKLHSLHLVQCTNVVQHLAAGLAAAASGCSSSSWPTPLPSFTALRVLEVSSVVGSISPLLVALQQQCQASASGSHNRQQGTASGALQQLQELHISHCSMEAAACSTSQQEELQQLLPLLPSLQVLHLSDISGLYAVPPGVLDCAGLTKLVLSSNDLLTEVPAGISQLIALQVLDLSGNALLRSLGPSFSSLTSLTQLNLSGPSGLWADYSAASSSGDIHSSTAAAAAVGSDAGPSRWLDNPSSGSSSAAAARAALPQLLLPALPLQQQQRLLPELGSLSNLQRLILSNNRQLMVLPSCVSKLGRLAVLDARGCGIRWLGEDVLECRGLQELVLADNVLAEVPDDISVLQQLQVLDIGGCSSLWRLPSALLLLTKLQRLVVASRAVGQHVIEQLELRPNPVEVEMEPPEGGSDDEDFSPILDAYDSEGDPVEAALDSSDGSD